MKVVVKVYDDVKYTAKAQKVAETIYNDVASIQVITLSNEQVCAMGFDEFDELNEYCILTFGDDTTATFRNSHIDVFKY